MKQYSVNTYILKMSWLFLFLWVISMGLWIVLLAMGNPNWFMVLSFGPFFLFWMIIASYYPQTVIVSEDSIAFQTKGSDRVQTFKYSELEFSNKKGYYEFVVTGTKKRKKFWISKKDIPKELETFLQDLSGE